jgi:8-oxo-dGTP diphosphatase
MKLSVCCIILNPEGLILAQNRVGLTGYAEDWNLIGGIADPGETALAALAREVFEETGLTLENPCEVYRAELEGYETIGYVCREYSGTLRASWEGAVEWQPLAAVTNPRCQYAAWNAPFFAALESFTLASQAEGAAQAALMERGIAGC